MLAADTRSMRNAQNEGLRFRQVFFKLANVSLLIYPTALAFRFGWTRSTTIKL